MVTPNLRSSIPLFKQTGAEQKKAAVLLFPDTHQNAPPLNLPKISENSECNSGPPSATHSGVPQLDGSPKEPL